MRPPVRQAVYGVGQLRNHTHRLRVRLRRAEEVGECWTIDEVLDEQRRQRRILIYLSVLAVRHATHMRPIYPNSFTCDRSIHYCSVLVR